MENENKQAEQTATAESTEATTENKELETENVDTDSTSGTAKFTQAQVDEMISKRLARETKKFEKKLLEVQAKKGTEPTDAEKITDLENQLKNSNKEILKYKLSKFATEAKVKAGRAEAFSRLVDLSDVDTTDDEAIKEAVLEAVKAYPEFVDAKSETEETKGFIKAGAENKTLTEEQKMRDQVRKAFGLK